MEIQEISNILGVYFSSAFNGNVRDLNRRFKNAREEYKPRIKKSMIALNKVVRAVVVFALFDYEVDFKNALERVYEAIQSLFKRKIKRTYIKWDDRPLNISSFHKDVTILII